MNQRTDLGWYTSGIDQPASNLGSLGFSGGLFTAVATGADPNFWLLDPGNPYAVNTGKTGSVYPIDTTKYKRIMLRMNVSGGAMTSSFPLPPSQTMQFLWTNNTLVGGINTSHSVPVAPGWWIHSVNLDTLGTAAGISWSAAPADSFRVDPVALSGVSLSLDWARLVEEDPSHLRNISWTGASSADLYLDNDTNAGNGFLGQIARNVSSSSYSFYAGGLPYGQYRVAVCPAGSVSGCGYAPGQWRVGDIPTLSFLSPSEQGSSDDFATIQLQNPWDMDSLADIDEPLNVTAPAIENLALESPEGVPLGIHRVLTGTSIAVPAPGSTDPYLYLLWAPERGATYRIDTNRYRILTLEMGVAGDRDINNGSVARIVWRVAGETKEFVSDDIILLHRSGANTLQTLILDMKSVPSDPLDFGSKTGWNGLLDSFRVDPHEFSDARKFWIRSVKLAALEQADASYTIRWTYAEQEAVGATLALYYDTSGTAYSGTLIAAGLNPSAGSAVWNTSALPPGNYYVYAVLMKGSLVLNRHYSRWPVKVSHGGAATGTISLNRAQLYFGATQNGATVTPSQDVVLTASASNLTWTATANQSWLSVTPSSGTGTANLSVRVSGSQLPSPATLDGIITIQSPGASNSPQSLRVRLRLVNSPNTQAPFGWFDTPTNGAAGLAGNIPVTGWALDDIAVEKVEIWRDPLPGEPASSNGLAYIGDAVFVPDARPDVAAAYPEAPRSYRAGWGYMMLTNFLPSASGPIGNGSYRIHAIALDREGKRSSLGAKSISVDNAHATKPFGTIDTPGQGGVVSGSSYVNFGWALTPPPYRIPADGSTLAVYIDGAMVGRPVYSQYRSDIATLFPSYLNSGAAVGYFFLDSTQLANGMHSIAWSVTDDGGRVDGIGSRYFFVLNGGAVPSESAQEYTAVAAAAPRATAKARQARIATYGDFEPGVPNEVSYRVGYGPISPLQPLSRESDGGLVGIQLCALDRLEIRLPTGAATKWQGFQWLLGRTASLPVGSTFDSERGLFLWQVGPGFQGRFLLGFRRDSDLETFLVPVEILPAANAPLGGAGAR